MTCRKAMSFEAEATLFADVTGADFTVRLRGVDGDHGASATWSLDELIVEAVTRAGSPHAGGPRPDDLRELRGALLDAFVRLSAAIERMERPE
jgi:hypothetical protein